MGYEKKRLNNAIVHHGAHLFHASDRSELEPGPGNIVAEVVGPAGTVLHLVLPWREGRAAAEDLVGHLPQTPRRRQAAVSGLLLELIGQPPPDADRSLVLLLCALGDWWAPIDSDQREDRRARVDRIMGKYGSACLRFEVMDQGGQVRVRTTFGPIPIARAA